MGLQAMEQQWGSGTEAVAEVLAGNAASQATFSKAGFRIDEISDIPHRSRPATRWRWSTSTTRS